MVFSGVWNDWLFTFGRDLYICSGCCWQDWSWILSSGTRIPCRLLGDHVDTDATVLPTQPDLHLYLPRTTFRQMVIQNRRVLFPHLTITRLCATPLLSS